MSKKYDNKNENDNEENDDNDDDDDDDDDNEKKSLFDRNDRTRHDLPKKKTVPPQNVNGYINPVNEYWVVQPPAYVDPSMAHLSSMYYPSYGFQMDEPPNVTKGPPNKPSGILPRPPVGRTSQPQLPPVVTSAMNPVHYPVAPPIPIQHNQPPPPPLPLQFPPPVPTQPILQHHFPPPPPPHLSYPQPLPLPPPPPEQYYRRTPPPYYYHSPRSRSPPYYYHDRTSLPPYILLSFSIRFHAD